MAYLIIVTLIWAFSFSLIKNQLSSLDPSFVAFIRLLISLLLFTPFVKIKNLSQKMVLQLMLIGALQYGLMYLAYIYAFKFLQAYQVALFTIFTPIYVTLIYDILKRHFHPLFFVTAFISVIGSAIIVYRQLGSSALQVGFLFVQISNISFAAGQVFYKQFLASKPELKDKNLIALLYLGAVMVTGLASFFSSDWQGMTIDSNQILTLLYLGSVASGLGFFLWNSGIRKTNIGTVAVFNNLKIPVAIAVALIFFSEQANIPRLLVGSILIFGALLGNELLITKSKSK